MLLVKDGPRQFEVGGRAAAMIRWIADQAARLNALPTMRLELNSAGRGAVKIKLEVCEGEIPVVG